MMRRTLLVVATLLGSCSRTPPPLTSPRPVAVTAPPSAQRAPWTARKVVANAPDRPAGSVIVMAGEGWSQLALRAGVPAGALAVANGLTLSAVLVPGQSIKVPGGRVHTVAAGETGIAIARGYGVEWSRVVAANRLVPPYTLEIGDRLLLPSKRTVAAMTIEQRAQAFRIDIDDLITGTEPAARQKSKTKPLSSPMAQNSSTQSAVVGPATPLPRPLPALPTSAPVFSWPVDGRILSSFGPKPGGRYNDGINLKATAGSIVRAAADGVVAYAGDAVAGFGNLILIKHADGWVTAYAHNQGLLVERGTRVRKGDPIARAGATGSVDEPQVHFELRRGRTAVDPVKLLPARG